MHLLWFYTDDDDDDDDDDYDDDDDNNNNNNNTFIIGNSVTCTTYFNHRIAVLYTLQQVFVSGLLFKIFCIKVATNNNEYNKSATKLLCEIKATLSAK
jgi:hypothetical protein